ncbi:MAG: phage tail tape measure protein [Dorea longicatena]
MDLFKLVGTIAIDTANAEKSLNDVHKQVADTEKAVSEGCDKVKQSSEKAGNSATKAGKTAEEAGKKAKKAGEDAGKGGQESEKSGNKWAEFGKKIEKAGTKVTGIGKKIEKAGDAVGKVGKKFAPLSAAAAGTLTAVTKGASDFQNGMAKMSTLFDTSQVSVKKLSKEFLNLSNETGKSAVELTEAGYQALSASVPVEKLGGFIRTSANMAKVGFTDTATSVDLLSTAVNAYGLEADQADSIANKLVNTQNLGKTSVNELASSMGKVIPTAAGMNVNLDQLCTMYTLMTKQGIATAESTTYMNSMLNELGDSGTDVGKVLKEKTGKSFQDLMKDGKTTGDALKILKDYSKETGTAFNELWSSQEAGKAAMALLNDSAGDFNETMGSMANVADLVGQGLEKMNTPSAKMAKALNRIKNSGIELGSVLLTTVAPYVEQFTKKVEELTEKFNKMPDSQKKMVLVMLAVVASISPVLAIMGKLIKVFADGPIAVGNLMKGFGKLQTAIAGINAPVLTIVAVIAVLVSAFTHLWNTNENFRNNMIAIWDQIRDKISSFVDNVKERFAGLNISFADIVSALKAIWDGFCEILAPVFEGAFAALADTITTVCDVLIGILDTFIGLFTGNWEQCWTGIQEVFGGIWEGIKAVLTDVLEALKGVIDTFLGWFGTDLDTVWSEITSTVESVWNGIVDFFASVWNEITSAASSAWETIKNVITVAIMLIGEIISAAVQIISLPWRFIWENCKEYIIAAWETIKNVISSALNTISSVISAGWNAISAVVTPVIDTIINIVSSGWNLISSVVSNVAQGILGVVSSVWNSISGVVSSVMGTISSVMSSGWNAAKGVVTSAISGIRSVISSGLHSASSVVSSVLSGIKSRFSNIWNGCKSVVSSAINHIKSAMNFSWSLPKLKLPHPKIEGKFSLDPPSVPHFSIDWYAKAMDAGMIMNKPTVFGYDAVSNSFMAGGEAGSETVVGTQSLMNMIQDAVNNSGNRDDGAVQTLLEAIYNWMRNGGLYKLMIDVLTNGVELELDNREIARLVRKYA